MRWVDGQKICLFQSTYWEKMSTSRQVERQSKKGKILSTQALNDPYVLRDKSALFYGPKPYSKASLMVPQCNAKKTLMYSLTQCVIMQTETAQWENREGVVFFGFFFNSFTSSFNLISLLPTLSRDVGSRGHVRGDTIPPPQIDQVTLSQPTGGAYYVHKLLQAPPGFQIFQHPSWNSCPFSPRNNLII